MFILKWLSPLLALVAHCATECCKVLLVGSGGSPQTEDLEPGGCCEQHFALVLSKERADQMKSFWFGFIFGSAATKITWHSRAQKSTKLLFLISSPSHKICSHNLLESTQPVGSVYTIAS